MLKLIILTCKIVTYSLLLGWAPSKSKLNLSKEHVANGHLAPTYGKEPARVMSTKAFLHTCIKYIERKVYVMYVRLVYTMYHDPGAALKNRYGQREKPTITMQYNAYVYGAHLKLLLQSTKTYSLRDRHVFFWHCINSTTLLLPS